MQLCNKIAKQNREYTVNHWYWGAFFLQVEWLNLFFALRKVGCKGSKFARALHFFELVSKGMARTIN